MLKIKDNVNLKELEKYRFVEYKDCFVRDYNNDFETLVDKKTREVFKVDYEYKFLENKYYSNSTYKINDLIKDGLVEKVEDEE